MALRRLSNDQLFWIVVQSMLTGALLTGVGIATWYNNAGSAVGFMVGAVINSFGMSKVIKN